MVCTMASSWVTCSRDCLQLVVIASPVGLAVCISDHPAGALAICTVLITDFAGGLQQVAAHCLAQFRVGVGVSLSHACWPQSQVAHPQSCCVSSDAIPHLAPICVQVAIAVALTFVFLSMVFPPAIVIPALLKLCSQGEQPAEVAAKAGYKALPDADAEGGISSSQASSGWGGPLQCMGNQ